MIEIWMRRVVIECVIYFRKEIIFSFYLTKVQKDTKLFNEGEPAFLFFIVLEGKLVCIKNKEFTTISSGSCIGQSALKENTLRDCSVKTKSDCKFLCLYGETYRNAIEAYEIKGIQERNEIIKKISFLSNFFLIIRISR